MGRKLKKKISGFNVMTLIGIFLVFLSFGLLIAIKILQTDVVLTWYGKYQNQLFEWEQRIASLNKKYIVIVCVYVLFALKSIIPVPLVPISWICVISGMVFDTWLAVMINVLGVILMVSIKYYLGYKRGGGVTHRILRSYDAIWNMLERDGKGNPWLLFICRFVPGFPINTVSAIYGAMHYDFNHYLILSTVGFTPKLISYAIIGRNVFDPLSPGFLMPIIALMFMSGITMVGTNYIIAIFKRNDKERYENHGKS